MLWKERGRRERRRGGEKAKQERESATRHEIVHVVACLSVCPIPPATTVQNAMRGHVTGYTL